MGKYQNALHSGSVDGIQNALHSGSVDGITPISLGSSYIKATTDDSGLILAH